MTELNISQLNISQFSSPIYLPTDWPEKLKESFRKWVIKFAHNEASKNGYCNADNFRIARIDNKIELEQYEKLRKEGCCGFFDEEIELKNFKIKFGFNYGH